MSTDEQTPDTVESPLERLEALLAENSDGDVPPDLILQAAGEANQLLGEALQRAVSMYNLMSGLMNEFASGIDSIDVTTETTKENA